MRLLTVRIGKGRFARHRVASGTTRPGGQVDGAHLDDQIAALREAVEADLSAARDPDAGIRDEGVPPSVAIPSLRNGGRVATPQAETRLPDHRAVLQRLRSLLFWVAIAAFSVTIGVMIGHAASGS